MDTRQRLGIMLAAIIVGGASVGVSRATAGPEWAVATETLAADQNQAQPTSTPTRPAAPSSIGDDLIYDFVGPNVVEPGIKVR